MGFSLQTDRDTSASPFRVEPRFRWVACLYWLGALAIACTIATSGLWSLVLNLPPPTTSTLLDGAEQHSGASVWGPMPLFVFRGSGLRLSHDHGIRLFGPFFNSTSHQRVLGGELVGPPHLWPWSLQCSDEQKQRAQRRGNGTLCGPAFNGNDLILMNLTELVPFFPTKATATFFVQGYFIDLFMAPANTQLSNVDAFVDQTSSIKGFEMQATVTQSILPRPGQHWDPFGKYTEPVYRLSHGSLWPSTALGDAAFGLGINMVDPVVVRIEAQSIPDQLVSLFAKLGGLASVFTCIFFLTFKRRYVVSEEQRQYLELTLLGYHRQRVHDLQMARPLDRPMSTVSLGD